MQDAIKCKIPVTFYHKLSIETWSARGAFEKKNLLFFLYFWLNIDWTLRYNWLNWKSKIYKVINVGMKVAIIAKKYIIFSTMLYENYRYCWSERYTKGTSN